MLTSYAQNFEDVILWRALKHIQNGLYIDVGASDPVLDSVSLAFYESGWRGLHVEPVKFFADRIRSARPDEEVVEALIGTQREPMPFYKVGTTGMNTGDRGIANQHQAAGFPIVVELIPCLPLSDILSRFKDREIHWLKIDVEGMEQHVIRSWLPSTSRPWIVVVEATKPNSPEQNAYEWEADLLALGYDFVYFDGLNRFYVSQAQSQLKASFGPGPNYFDRFSLTRHSVFTQPLLEKLSTLEIELISSRQSFVDIQRNLDAHLAKEDATQSELSELKTKVSLYDLKFTALQQELENANLHRTTVLKSTSWRLTRPLRVAVDTSRFIKRGVWASMTFAPHSRLRRTANKLIGLSAYRLYNSGLSRALLRTAFNYAPHLKRRLRLAVADNLRLEKNTVDWKALDSIGLQSGTTYGQGRGIEEHVDTKAPRTIILFVGHTIACSTNTGVQRTVRGLASGLVRAGTVVRYVKWDTAAKRCVLISAEERVYLSNWNGPKLSESEKSIYNVDASSLSVGYDSWFIIPEVIHAEFQGPLVALDLIIWARVHGLKVGFLFYDAIPLLREEFVFMAQPHALYMQHLRLADIIWPISKWSAFDLESFWLSSEKANVKTIPVVRPLHLPAGISSSHSSEHRSKDLILSVGTIETRKNQLALVRAFQSYQKDHPNSSWKLTLLGNLHPDVAAEVMSAIKIDRSISHFPSVSDEALDELYRSCAFTVFPSLEEGFGLPILESLSYGKACICANFGAMAEVAEGGGCVTVDVRNEASILSAIDELIGNPDLLQSLGAEAKARTSIDWVDYAELILGSIDRMASIRSKLGVIYYRIELIRSSMSPIGTHRVVRRLAQELIRLGIKLIPIRWDEQTGSFLKLDEREMAQFSKWNVPTETQWSTWVEMEAVPANSWMVTAGISTNDACFRQSDAVRDAKSKGLRLAAIFYDAIPWKLRESYPDQFSFAHKKYMLGLGDYDVVLSVSDFSRGDLIQFLGDALPKPQSLERQIQTISLPGEFLEHTRITAIPISRSNDIVKILCIGAVEPRKNYLVLLEAFLHATASSNKVLELVIAGSRTEAGLAHQVSDIVAAHPAISWEEDADSQRLRELYAQCDFTVYASVEEGAPLPILTSLWHGKPSICANFGAMSEFADGGGCLTVDVRDPQSLAEALLKLTHDVSLRQKLVEQAVERPIKSWKQYAEEFASKLANFPTSELVPAKDTTLIKAMQTRAQNMKIEPRPKLSICISTYNRAEWLSINLKNWARLYPMPFSDVELLVCDNASTDHTSEVVRPYLQRADFSYRCNPQNVGMLGNLRETANYARGDYIWIVGDDDLLMAGSIERILKAINDNDGVALVYLNYAFTRIEDARTVVDLNSFFAEATSIVPTEADIVGLIKDICARNENFFTAIYTLVLRRDHAISAYSQNTAGRPFSTMLTCIPTTYYVLNYMMDEPGIWIGTPQIVVNMNVSWMKYAPLWILERIPEIYELAESKGVAAKDIDRWRSHSFAGVIHYFDEIYRDDPLDNALYFSPSRLVRRFKHLPEFAEKRRELKSIYQTAYAAGSLRAIEHPDIVFP